MSASYMQHIQQKIQLQAIYKCRNSLLHNTGVWRQCVLTAISNHILYKNCYKEFVHGFATIPFNLYWLNPISKRLITLTDFFFHNDKN